MRKLFLLTAAVLMLAAFGFAVACEDDEPSAEEARAALCGDLEQLDVALVTFMELDAQSTIGEVRAARDGVTDAADAVVSSAEDVEEAEIVDLQQAYHTLGDSISNIQDDQTVQEVLDAVSISAQDVAAAHQQLFADLGCGGATPTTEAQATEEPTVAETVPAETPVATESPVATETVAPAETPAPTEAAPTAEGA